eukprot:TRINITY_DN21021_c5_g1_i1.p1 TRINITY_DN21021_c5_g1~~TRINITY_DN21021_c5_g1_i1.p1  ORF type:complete len:399 (+),score=163.81 TRINITY_DN21021_c5_g1_i1:236-1432(+)
MKVAAGTGGKKLECSGRDPIVDPLRQKGVFGYWEKYEPVLDGIPKIIPKAVDDLVEPLAQAILVDPERDTLLVRHTLAWTLINLPLAMFILFWMEETTFNLSVFGLIHFFLWFTAMDTYVLGLHVVCHRRVFKGPLANVLYHYYSTILGPIFGETPETYYVHHIGMHHTYNNHFKDLSCTLQYRRDSFTHWLCYLGKFIAMHYDLYKLFAGSNQKLVVRFFTGEIGWLLFVLYNAVSRPIPTLLVLVMPVLIMRCGMMAGNWGQHAFINPKEPTTNFGHSVNIIDSAYNRRCYNDGYHIMHHLHPSAHYTELPQLFCKELDSLIEHDCVVFSHPKWDFAAIWFHLMIGDYDTLAKHYVNLDPKNPRSHEEIKAMLKSRTQRVYSPSEFGADGKLLKVE